MPKVVITHAVVDLDRWLEGKSERAAAIESGTGSNVTDYVAHDGSNNIAITADVQDVDALQAMLASPKINCPFSLRNSIQMDMLRRREFGFLR